MLKFKEYKQLDGSVKRQVSEVGRILRRFDKTPYPTKETDVICPHFMLLAWANGCMYNCSWCYLKGTFRFYGQKPNGRVPIILKDRKRIAKEIVAFLKADLPPEIINTGELSDSLLDEGSDPFSSWIMQYFNGTRHKVLFLTKSTNIDNFLKHEWQKNAILSWSINATEVAKRWELYAPTPEQRLEAAKKVADAGYEVRLRIDPMVPILDWQRHYQELVDMVFSKLEPSRVTLGCLRGLISTIVYAKDKSWTTFLKEQSNWGKKPPFEERLAMYTTVIDKLKSYGLKHYAVCKDTVQIWKALKLNMNAVTCNCVW